MRKLNVGIIGATGYVGQRFVSLLQAHPYFKPVLLAASSRSAGKRYGDLMETRWKLETPLPEAAKTQILVDAADLTAIASACDFVFCAVDMPKDAIRSLEERLARMETPVISNNSAHRWTEDVPVIIPEINPEHAALIELQRKRLGTKRGFIVCKPNCSIQSYVPALSALRAYGLDTVFVSTYQAISGAGKTFQDWPEMEHNLIPYIAGEEEKTEREPLKIWGDLRADGGLNLAEEPRISAQCYRVAVAEGHTAAVSVGFRKPVSREAILEAWRNYRGQAQDLQLPTAPSSFLIYHEEADRPQPRLDAGAGNGMSISLGRLREDPILDWKFTCFSHNTLRGAAGGAVETAELLYRLGYLEAGGSNER